jgi:hypothetical protein
MCYGFVNMIGDFSPVCHGGGGGGWAGGGGVLATFIVLPLTLHANTDPHIYIHTHPHTLKKNMQYTEVFIYLIIYFLIY